MKRRNKTHYYFRSMTGWESSDGKERKFVVWFKDGGRIRGMLGFRFFDTREAAMVFVNSLEK